MTCSSKYDLTCTDRRCGDHQRCSCDAAVSDQRNHLGEIYSNISFLKPPALLLTLWIRTRSILRENTRCDMQADVSIVNRDHNVHEVDAGAHGCNGRHAQLATRLEICRECDCFVQSGPISI